MKKAQNNLLFNVLIIIFIFMELYVIIFIKNTLNLIIKEGKIVIVLIIFNHKSKINSFKNSNIQKEIIVLCLIYLIEFYI
jgi:hypothetical protein